MNLKDFYKMERLTENQTDNEMNWTNQFIQINRDNRFLNLFIVFLDNEKDDKWLMSLEDSFDKDKGIDLKVNEERYHVSILHSFDNPSYVIYQEVNGKAVQKEFEDTLLYDWFLHRVEVKHHEEELSDVDFFMSLKVIDEYRRKKIENEKLSIYLIPIQGDHFVSSGVYTFRYQIKTKVNRFEKHLVTEVKTLSDFLGMWF